jgi:hypothetical protein
MHCFLAGFTPFSIMSAGQKGPGNKVIRATSVSDPDPDPHSMASGSRKGKISPKMKKIKSEDQKNMKISIFYAIIF